MRACNQIKGARLLMEIVTPKITLIAKTEVLYGALAELEPKWFNQVATDDLTSELIIEFAGRECYQSWDKPNIATSTLKGYIANLKKQRHFSVLEHASATFRFQNVSRSLTHELVRHRHFSYSQLSQRYVDGSGIKVVIHPDVQKLIHIQRQNELPQYVDESLDNLLISVEKFYSEVDRAMGDAPIKERRGAARGALSNMTATNIVVTGNLRAWRHFILMRCTPQAEIEIREAAWTVFRSLRKEFPSVFSDLEASEHSDSCPTVTSEYMEAE